MSKLKTNMVPGLSPPGSRTVPSSISATGIGHGTLQKSNKKWVLPASLGHGELQQHTGEISCGFRQTGRHTAISEIYFRYRDIIQMFAKCKGRFAISTHGSKLHLYYTGCQGWMQWSKVSYMNLPPLKIKLFFIFKSTYGILPDRNKKQGNCKHLNVGFTISWGTKSNSLSSGKTSI